MMMGASPKGRRSAPPKLAQAPLRALMGMTRSAFPFKTHGLDGRRDIAVGVAQDLLGLAGLVCRSEQRTALIVFTVNQWAGAVRD